jgi:SAM-dependent methyltransferase
MLSRADGSRLPLASGSMASAFSNSVLEHIPPVDAVLREIGRVLAKGAPLAFTVPNPAFLSELSVRGALRKIGAEALADSYAAWFRWITRVKHLDEEGTWAARLSQAGFHLERTFRYFSPEALRVMEWGHYFGAPSLLARWITGRWIVWPAPLNLRLTLSLIRRYDESSARPDGTFTFYLARRK